jgi:nucleotide-binding universal stress UspA family protein
MSMAQIHRILCAVDLAGPVAGALKHAAAFARWSGARLAVVHVVAPADFRMAAAASLDGSEPGRGLRALRGFVEPVAGRLTPRLVVREGDAAAEIVAESRDWGADLVVVGTHDRRGFERWELGSVAEQVIRNAPCPVLTVPRGSRPVAAGGDPPFRSLLCALDLGPASATALEYALTLGLRARAGITVLHAMEEIPVEGRRMELRLGVPWFAAYRETVERQARTRLRELLPEEVRAACEVKELVVRGGAGRQIARVAKLRGADLVVLGAGSGGLLSFRSTAAAVVRRSPCPVLTLPSRTAVRAADLALPRQTVPQPTR